MVKGLLFYTILVSVFSLSAQVGMGEWRMHISPYVGQEVVTANDAVYISLNSGLLEYDLEFNEKTLRTAADYLSDFNTVQNDRKLIVFNLKHGVTIINLIIIH